MEDMFEREEYDQYTEELNCNLELQLEKKRKQWMKLKSELDQQNYGLKKQNLDMVLTTGSREEKILNLQEGFCGKNQMIQEQVCDLELLVKSFQSDLLTNLPQEPQQLKQVVRELYERYVQTGNKVDKPLLDENTEFVQHSKLLKKSILTLKHKLAHQQAALQAKNDKIMKDNMVLMQKVNNLRKGQKTLQSQLLGGQHQKSVKNSNRDSGAEVPVQELNSPIKRPGKKNTTDRKKEEEEKEYQLSFFLPTKLKKRHDRRKPHRLPAIMPKSTF